LRFPEPNRIFVNTDPDLATARNRLATEALDWGADKLFFLDDDTYPCVWRRSCNDVKFDPDAPKLLLEHDAPAVSALYSLATGEYACYKQAYDIVPYLKGEVKLGEVFEVEGFGFGCCVIDAEVFRTIPRPWFKWLTDVDYVIRRGEDVFLTRRMRDFGFRMLVDGRVVCKHIVTYFLKHERKVEYPGVERI